MQRIANPGEAKIYVFEMAKRASWARSVDTWPLASDNWSSKPDPINGTFSDRSTKGSQELLSSFLHGNEDLRDGEIDNDRPER